MFDEFVDLSHSDFLLAYGRNQPSGKEQKWSHMVINKCRTCLVFAICALSSMVLALHHYCCSALKESCITKSTASRLSRVVSPLVSVCEKSDMLCPVWGSSVQEGQARARPVERLPKCLRGWVHDMRMRELGSLSLENSSQRRDLIAVYN